MNQQQRKERLTRVAFILQIFLFALGALSSFQEGKPIFGLVQATASIANLLMVLPVFTQQRKQQIMTAVLTFTIIVALYTAYYLWQSDKQYVQYLWLLAAFISIVPLYRHVKSTSLPKSTT